MWNLGDLFGASAVCSGDWLCDNWVLSQIWAVAGAVLAWDLVQGLIVTILTLSLLRRVFSFLRFG